MNLESYNPLTQRFIVSGISISIVLSAIYFSFTPWLSLLVPLAAAAAIGQALREFYGIARIKGLHPRETTGLFFSALIIAGIFLNPQPPLIDLFPLMGVVFALVTIFSLFIFRGEDPLVNIAATLFGIIYLTIPLSCTIAINYFFKPGAQEDGRWWLAYLLTITYITDTGGLFVGKTIGRTKLAPYISPKKTWEGALGGFISALLVSLSFAALADKGMIPMKLGFLESLVLGASLSVLAQLGDLAESLLKRDAGIKDSSSIPGLGGMLDVTDSLVFTAPLLYLYLSYNNI